MSPKSLGLFLFLSSPLYAQSLDVPPRPLIGREWGSVCPLDRRLAARRPRGEDPCRKLKAGNVPPFLRKLVPVSVSAGNVKATYFVAPDYLAIGSDDDYFLTPLTPLDGPGDRGSARLRAADDQNG